MTKSMTLRSFGSRLLPADAYDLTEGDRARAASEEKLGMLPPSTPSLGEASKIVDPKLIQTPLIRRVIKRLLLVSGAQQENSKRQGAKRMLVGLAAPQSGEQWRIIVIDTRVTVERKNAGRLECLINPEIIWRSRETEEGREGCFSAGPVWGLVRRPIAVKVRAFTPDGQKIERVFEDFTARIVQHEIDHLDGIRFPDRIKNDKKRHWVHAEEIALYPENIRRWPRLCTAKRWQESLRGL